MARRPLAIPFGGEEFRSIRERAGLDLTSLARELEEVGHKVHPSTLGKIEAEKHRPSPALLRALTVALHVSVDDFAPRPVDQRSVTG